MSQIKNKVRQEMSDNEPEKEDPLNKIADQLNRLNNNLEKLIRKDYCSGQTYVPVELTLDTKLHTIIRRAYSDK